MKQKADIGLIGLAVMGENLVLNMESKGFTVAVYNRTVEKVDKFIGGRGAGKNFIGAHSIKDLCDSLEKPRKVMMLVKAGKAVDDFIEQLLPHMEPGDIIIDGGNTHFPDTIRRTKYVESKGLLYVGTGVSGGEEGALLGPSMMPGGSPAAWLCGGFSRLSPARLAFPGLQRGRLRHQRGRGLSDPRRTAARAARALSL